MPTIRRDASKAEERAPFGVYDGPEPPDSTYRGVIKSITLKNSSNNNDYLNILVELDASPESPKAQYNGFAAWTMITLDGGEVNLSRERSLYMAIAGKPEVAILTDDGKPSPRVTKIGGVNPIGTRVLVQVKDPNDGYGPKGQWIYADGEAPKPAPAKDDDDEGESVRAEPKSNVTPMKRAAKKAAPAKEEPAEDDPHSMTLPQLRAYAKGKGIDISGKSKKLILDELEDKAEENDAETQLSPQDVKKMSEEDLVKLLETPNAEGVSYSVDDFTIDSNGKLDRDEVIEVLADDGVILPF